jgi:hypothetical protein
MDHSNMDHGKMNHGKMDHSKMNHSNIDHGKMDHGKMDHSKMDHSKMDHSNMDHARGAMGGHAHHHHGSFKEIFLKSLPLGIAILLLLLDGYSMAFPNHLSLCRRCSSCLGNQFCIFMAETFLHGCEG